MFSVGPSVLPRPPRQVLKLLSGFRLASIRTYVYARQSCPRVKLGILPWHGSIVPELRDWLRGSTRMHPGARASPTCVYIYMYMYICTLPTRLGRPGIDIGRLNATSVPSAELSRFDDALTRKNARALFSYIAA